MDKLFICAMDIGEQMLISGAEVHRVEESIERMCYAFGAKRVDIFTITSSMIATVYTTDGKHHTASRRITAATTDFEKIHHLNELSRKICEQKLSAEEIQKELKAIENCKTYPLWLEVLCYALIAAAFTLFFGGNIAESVVSLIIGAIVRFAVLFSEKTIANKIFGKFFSSTVATALAFLAVNTGILNSVDKVIIGNIMTLIPGVGLTNALRDLFTGDSIAGLLRSIEAVLSGLAIAAGYFLIVVLGGML